MKKILITNVMFVFVLLMVACGKKEKNVSLTLTEKKTETSHENDNEDEGIQEQDKEVDIKEKIAKVMGIGDMNFDIVQVEKNSLEDRKEIKGRLCFNEDLKEEYIAKVAEMRDLAMEYSDAIWDGGECTYMFTDEVDGREIGITDCNTVYFDKDVLKVSVSKVSDKDTKDKLEEIIKQIEGENSQLFLCYWNEDNMFYVQFRYYDIMDSDIYKK
ncbi:MAG: hypothetical protein K6G26_08780 [Lachnospiraceae bacterium]|nr:hypothetical protein [Lachnospiraceae bacterium]